LESRIENRQDTPRIIWPKPLAGLQEVKIADLPDDISSGLTLAALVIPLNIGYAQVAGLNMKKSMLQKKPLHSQ
jgi:MFS superfamily sulfate permease-like transporter